MKTEPTLILSEEDIDIKIKRISLQILEACINEESIVVAGIEKNGFKMAESILKNLNKLCDFN
jgi:pyrimidine operon attenuation protein/uracil phosphoribosyltransferase